MIGQYVAIRTESMTQVVTVSAVTAAYASQGLKASARVSGTSPSEKSLRQLHDETMLQDGEPQSTRDIVGTSAMTLFFLTAGQKRNQPQTYQKHAEEEYLLNNLDETSAPPKPEEEIEALDDDLAGSLLDDMMALTSPVMALPDLSDRSATSEA